MKSNRLAAIVAALAVAFTVSSALGASGVPKSYPLKDCVVSNDTLGEHGKAIKVTAPDGTDVYLCCKDCKKDFDKNPEKFAKMVKEAKAKK